MSGAALAFYPLWAASLAVGFTAWRLGRSVGRGLVILCFALAAWVTGLVLLVATQSVHNASAASISVADRFIPMGMVLAGAFIHAGADIAQIKDRRIVYTSYAVAIAVAIFGAAFPRLLYGPGVRGAGPLFFPLAALSIAGVLANKLWLFSLIRKCTGPQRSRLLVLLVANFAASIGGGGAAAIRVLDLAPIELSAPFLLLSIVLATHAVVFEERGRSRDVLVQALVYAVLTALFSALGLTLFFKLLPHLSPGPQIAWIAFVIFFAALPLDPMRSLLVDAIGARMFARPIALDVLTREIETKEVEREQAEGLAELGRLASAVAHEIRNPLGVIVAQAKVLEKQGASAEQVAEIRAQVDRAKHFLDDLLRFAKPRPLALRELDVRSVAGLAASNVRQAMGLTGDGPFRIEEGSPMFIEADRSAVLDVATALFQNAAIAVSEQPDGHVIVAFNDLGKTIEMVVTDNGPGVPREIESRLFQLFVTGRGRDHAHPGTGIGLALATRWLARHGGSLRHERPTNGGAQFIAVWPKAAAR
ncbi:MAG: HAMP domain-containing histidine kinase [Polyangiaceae bacterium]|nr:HAMP domain-containing histidine kinase [Polyangiaceae bacterium]